MKVYSKNWTKNKITVSKRTLYLYECKLKKITLITRVTVLWVRKTFNIKVNKTVITPNLILPLLTSNIGNSNLPFTRKRFHSDDFEFKSYHFPLLILDCQRPLSNIWSGVRSPNVSYGHSMTIGIKYLLLSIQWRGHSVGFVYLLDP